MAVMMPASILAGDDDRMVVGSLGRTPGGGTEFRDLHGRAGLLSSARHKGRDLSLHGILALAGDHAAVEQQLAAVGNDVVCNTGRRACDGEARVADEGVVAPLDALVLGRDGAQQAL